MNAALLTVTPSAAASAYQRVGAGAGAGSSDGGGFGDTLDQVLRGAVAAGQDADRKAQDAVVGGGDITSVVTAVSKAQVALQEIVGVRDKVVQAYQEVMRMAI